MGYINTREYVGKTKTYNLGSDNEVFKYSYSYDSNSNVTTVHENDSKVMQFTYDSLNQLKTSADKNSERYNIYTYDNSGNITKKQEYTLHLGGWHPTTLLNTVNYKYENSAWGDMLTEYDGQALTYDEIGNPLTYRNSMTMSWSGRELQSITKNSNTYTFTYNLNGLRTKKNSNGNNTYYYYDDSNNLIGLKKGTATVLFYYDSEGKVCSMSVGENTYFFIKNLQGDVTKIIDENGEACATYAYDAWGALLTQNEDSSVEGLNPFRYRGYVYDTETELYYLQSRYYDPKTGRFINADDSDYTDTFSGSPLSTNMFAYCENNAVNGYDPSGNWVAEEYKNGVFTPGHPTLIKNLPSTIKKWVLKADDEFGNKKDKVKGYKNKLYCSEPFHARETALEIFKCIYNKAIQVKKEGKHVKFDFSNKEGKQYLTNKYFAARLTREKGAPLTCANEMSQTLKDTLNDIKSYKEQSEALLGLALHTIQDYFAHKIQVYGRWYFYDNYLGEYPNMRKSSVWLTCDITMLNQQTGWSTRDIEDDPDILPWRFKKADSITSLIYSKYKSNIMINSISASKSSVYENPVFYNRKSNRLFHLTLWYKKHTVNINWG